MKIVKVQKGFDRKGIAYHTLDLLTAEARKKGITQISLEATPMGRKLYEKYGVVRMENEMEMIISKG